MAEGEKGENGSHETPEEGSLPHNGNIDIDVEDMSLEQLVHEASNEYQDLTNTMDAIDEWMTDIEEQNDSLVSKLKDLLESNKQIRAEIQQENQMDQTAQQSVDDKEHPSDQNSGS
ncbi:hypothetical protein FSP39_024092 [Pinctada imbricata]|uniref:Uncharacterized protein n=1 Tax=Pinctada imbricata TaxID=66713 RepID=A0AA89BZV3_PINIB|nr:hypothetical protein FSP39_024092 [Pinctada imbricata]